MTTSQPLLTCLHVGRASADILADIDYHVSSPLGMHLKVAKLLTYRGMCNYRSYQSESEELTEAGLRSFENLNKTDVILSSLEAENIEAAIRSIIEATSWIDWLAFCMKSMALKSPVMSVLSKV